MAAVSDISKTSAYQDKLLGLLGQREPLKVLGETPNVLAQMVKETSPEVLKRRPFEGKWTPTEVLGHLVDAEFVLGYRARQIYSENEPQILSMDQDKWVTAQRYANRDAAELVEQFRHLREVNLQLWRGMNADALKRCGRHSERGLESLGLMMKMNAGHDLSHIDQLTRYIAAAKKG
ncbi:MAG TPA: DinB family protein [Phycisphaerae bacterium]|nr:DinB family protein [Phycisphaerae bacterium]